MIPASLHKYALHGIQWSNQNKMTLFIIVFGLVNLAFSQECPPGEFLCPVSGVCIPQNLVCDGYADCLGGSDEVNCPSTTTTPCPGMECPVTGECIPQSWICDGYVDCADGSDEQNCPTTPCSGFVCNDGRCIPRYGECDGVPHCEGWEDELGCPCDDGFQCLDGICIPKEWHCDGLNDCPDGSDEQNCSLTTTTPCSGFVCNDGRCLPGDWQCDGFLDCDDGEDEAGCPCDGFKCSNNNCIPGYWVCDGENDCGDWGDETEEACPCADNEIRCPKNPGSDVPGKCIPPEFICDADGIWDCPDGFDETNCTKINHGKIKPTRTKELYRPDAINVTNIKQMLKIALKEEDRKRFQSHIKPKKPTSTLKLKPTKWQSKAKKHF